MRKKEELGVRFESKEERRSKVIADALTSAGGVGASARRFVGEDVSKLEVLCEHYEIEDGPAKYFDLALALARELYPEPKRRGRKSKWTTIRKGVLVVEVERVRRDDLTHGVEWACKQLAKCEPWISILESKVSPNTSPDPAEALRQVYYEFREDKWAAIFRESLAVHNSNGEIEEWNRKVLTL